MVPKVEDDVRIRVGYRILIGGALIAFWDAGIGWFNKQPWTFALGVAAGLSLLLMIPVLRRTRSLDLAFAIAATCGELVCILGFLLSGESLFLYFGTFVPIGASMLTSPRMGATLLGSCGIALLVANLAVKEHWIDPLYSQGEMVRGRSSETTFLLLMAVICGSSIFREIVIKATEQKRRLADSALQKQLHGMRLLAETTNELLTVELSEARWSELLSRVADHLDCDVFTNYEVEFDKLRLRAFAGLPESLLGGYRVINIGEKICGLCAQTHKLIYFDDQRLASCAEASELFQVGVRVIAAVPLVFGEKLVGTLSFASTRKGSFASEELDFITTVGQAVASVRGRMLAEAQTRVSELRFRTIVDFAADAFFLVDRDLKIVDVNRQACISLGYTREELLAMRVPEIANSLSASLSFSVAERKFEDDVVVDTGVHRRKDGTEFQFEAHVSPVTLDGADYLIVLTHDASERKLVADRMIQSQKLEAIGRLAGGVAHDFNNLLCVINSYSEMLKDDERLAEADRRWMRAIFDAGQRGAKLTRQLLVFGRKAIFEPKPIDLNEVVEAAHRLLERLIGENIELVSKLNPDPCVVLADRSQLDQVLLNLAVNARDSMPRGGRLTLTTDFANDESGRDCIQLVVSDTGCGIADELLPHVFDPFFTTKDVGQGTGLGLAVVYGIVKQSGGSIEVASELGTGTRFTITLPAHKIHPRSSNAVPSDAPLHRDTKAVVLLVEDELPVREVTSLLLKRQSFTVLEAQSSRHAIELAKQHAGSLSAVLTDIVMPDLNGPEIIAEIRKFLPNLPVLYMSGYSFDVIAQVTDMAEHQGILKKPFTYDELSSQLHAAIAKNAR